jgi:hypothetical protein
MFPVLEFSARIEPHPVVSYHRTFVKHSALLVKVGRDVSFISKHELDLGVSVSLQANAAFFFNSVSMVFDIVACALHECQARQANTLITSAFMFL